MDRIVYDQDKFYFLMNKPKGYVCSSVSDSHKTVYDLLSADLQELVTNPIRGERLHTVGRLDCDTTGLLIFTDDGKFSHNLTDPKNQVLKKYKVVLSTPVDEKRQEYYKTTFAQGVSIPKDKKSDECIVESAKIEFLSCKECIVHVTEGKFHQIKRMFLAVDNNVVELKRLSMGPFELPEDLCEGEYINIFYPMIKLCNMNKR